jgi:wyosine [tRNA(Phe)-imidazoG37] synthetase (radical SAM superfamily)
MKYVFGPVPSRRLGQSLGIDTIPLKTCNWNCVYCQLGRTRPLTNQRKEYSPVEDILAEVGDALEAHKPGEIDWITFVGSGETLLHSGTGWLIRQIKNLTPLPIAVITNGSLFYLPEARQELTAADAVLPTLDAGTAELYRKINRPPPDISFDRLVEGMAAFRNMYPGNIWVEVMLVQGLNDTSQALEDIAKVLQRIRPDVVHINLPTRPPVEAWVGPPSEESLMKALTILGSIAKVVHPTAGSFDLSGFDNLVDAIVGVITRHPMSQAELERTLERWSPGQLGRVLKDLVASGLVQVVERNGTRYWVAASSRFPDKIQSLRSFPR